ncbi:MAG: HD domain-containing phosphohydrolase [Desulfovermiculus sp.]
MKLFHADPVQILSDAIQVLEKQDRQDKAFDALTRHLARLCRAKGATLRAADQSGQELELMAAWGLSPEYLNKGPVSADPYFSEINEQGVFLVRDIFAERKVQYPQEADKEGIKAILGLPLPVGGSMNMVLRLYFGFDPDPDQEDMNLLDCLARQAACCLKGIILHTRYVQTFQQVSSAIHSGENVEQIITTIVSTIQEVMQARGCIYWILNTEKRQVHMKVASGFLVQSLSQVEYDILEDVFEITQDREVYFQDVRDDPRIPSYNRLGKLLVVSMLGIPFPIVDGYTGVLAVYFSSERHLVQSEIDFVRSLGEQGALALQKMLRFDQQMVNSFKSTIEGLVLALEAKDVCTHGHSLNVARLSWAVAREIGFSEDEADTVYHAGLLHDIGKIAMHNDILDNLGNLSLKEFEQIKKHPVIGARILKPLSFLDQVAKLILHHHERFDGSGYPQGLAGEEIPLGSRIIAVCDSFDAMVSDRPNSERMSVSRAVKELHARAGSFFDPEIVRTFAQVIAREPEKVTPFKVSKDYFQKYKQELKEPKKKPNTLADWILKGSLGF